MLTKKFFQVYYPNFEKTIILLMALSLMLAISYATILFCATLVKTVLNLGNALTLIISAEPGADTVSNIISQLQSGLYKVFGGFLLILLGIELIDTVKTFYREHHIKIKSIIAVAIIATARHLISLDYHHISPLAIFAVGFVVLALILGYFLLGKQNTENVETKD